MTAQECIAALRRLADYPYSSQRLALRHAAEVLERLEDDVVAREVVRRPGGGWYGPYRELDALLRAYRDRVRGTP